jgi:hypothetical protein
MWVIQLLVIVALISSIDSNAVHCSTKYAANRKNFMKHLTDGDNAHLMVSVNQESLKLSKSGIGRMITKNLTLPMMLTHIKSRANRLNDMTDIHGFVVGAFLVEGLFKYEGKLMDWMNYNQVYVFSRADKLEEFHFFETCRIKKMGDRDIKVEKSAVLLIEATHQKKNIMEGIKIRKEFLVMENFSIEEFEVQGFDICEHVEFYMNECREKPKEYPKRVFFFLATMFLYMLVLVLLFCIETFTKNPSLNCSLPFNRPSNRVVPINPPLNQSLN